MEKREMTAVFVCSPFRPSSKEPAVAKDQLASNINRAVMACKLLIRLGHLPLAPHLYFPRFLDDAIASEREDGSLGVWKRNHRRHEPGNCGSQGLK